MVRIYEINPVPMVKNSLERCNRGIQVDHIKIKVEMGALSKEKKSIMTGILINRGKFLSFF